MKKHSTNQSRELDEDYEETKDEFRTLLRGGQYYSCSMIIQKTMLADQLRFLIFDDVSTRHMLVECIPHNYCLIEGIFLKLHLLDRNDYKEFIYDSIEKIIKWIQNSQPKEISRCKCQLKVIFSKIENLLPDFKMEINSTMSQCHYIIKSLVEISSYKKYDQETLDQLLTPMVSVLKQIIIKMEQLKNEHANKPSHDLTDGSTSLTKASLYEKLYNRKKILNTFEPLRDFYSIVSVIDTINSEICTMKYAVSNCAMPQNYGSCQNKSQTPIRDSLSTTSSSLPIQPEQQRRCHSSYQGIPSTDTEHMNFDLGGVNFPQGADLIAGMQSIKQSLLLQNQLIDIKNPFYHYDVNDQNTVPQAELADEITEDDNDNLGLRNSRPRDISSALESHISSHTTSHPSLNDPMRPFSLPNRESSIDLEVNNLRSEVKKLREELLSCKENVKHLQQKEIQLQDRLSKQAQKQFSRGPTKFEDLSIGAQRPSELIRSFGDIYTESRVDAFDSLDEITQLQGFDDLKCKLLFSIVVLSFRSVEREIATMKQQIRDVLNNYTNPMFLSRDSSSDCNNDSNDEDYNSNNKNTLSSGESINTDPLECFITEFEPLVNDYLFESVGQHRHDITKNIEEVSTQICLTLYDYPELRQNDGLALYIEEIVRLAWSLSVQKPALTIVYDFSEFDPDVHKRFHSSNPEQDIIQAVLWPALREHNGTKIVHKAIVVT